MLRFRTLELAKQFGQANPAEVDFAQLVGQMAAQADVHADPLRASSASYRHAA
jgi:hypothetical protein